MEECNVTASPNNEPVSEIGDSDADSNYAISDKSSSGTSD
jgi:hypothetical protein